MIYLLLPAYNEGENLKELLRDIRELSSTCTEPLHIVLVNDGSQDNTHQVAQKLLTKNSATILTHRENCGLGAALETGFAFLLHRLSEKDVVVTMDADNSHLPSQIPDLVSQIEKGSDLAMASRYIRGAVQKGVPLHRRLPSKILDSYLSLSLSPTVSDFTRRRVGPCTGTEGTPVTPARTCFCL